MAAITAETAENAEKATELDRITEMVIGAAIDVRRALGPGLLESTYEACLAFEPGDRGLRVERQSPLPVVYKDVKLDCGYRIDLLVEDQVVVELKTVERLQPVRDAQVLSYLKLSGCKVGLLANFNVKILKQGLRRLVDRFPDAASACSASSAVR